MLNLWLTYRSPNLLENDYWTNDYWTLLTSVSWHYLTGVAQFKNLMFCFLDLFWSVKWFLIRFIYGILYVYVVYICSLHTLTRESNLRCAWVLTCQWLCLIETKIKWLSGRCEVEIGGMNKNWTKRFKIVTFPLLKKMFSMMKPTRTTSATTEHARQRGEHWWVRFWGSCSLG